MNMYVEYAISKLTYFIGSRIKSPIAAILMLHRVAPRNRNNLGVLEDQKVAPEYLEEFIILSKKKGYTFISIDEMISAISAGEYPTKCFVISFDDGYKDTFSTAYPLLKSYNVPFVFYVSTSFPDKTALTWWYMIHDIVLDNDKIILDKKIINCRSIGQKQKTYITLSKKILRMGRYVGDKLPLMLSHYERALHTIYSDSYIDWDEISTMSKDNLCTIGAHSADHYGLRYEQVDFIFNDFVLCKTKLREKTGKEINHLAYPYGTVYSVGFRESSIAKKAGFSSAVTTFNSCIYWYHKKMLHCLPRINFTQTFNPSVYLF